MKTLTLLKSLGILFLLIVSTNAFGQWTQVGQSLEGEDSYDHFGSAISLNGDGSIMAVGTYQNDNIASNSGNVKIYDNTTGAWQMLGQELNGEIEDGYFGRSISLNGDGNVIAIGAHGENENGINSGTVRVFVNIDDNWQQIGDNILGDAIDNKFGYSLSLNTEGNILAIGAILNSENGTSSGQVKIFENISGVWEQIGENISGATAGDYFGYSVSLSSNGNIVAIGAPYHDEGGNNSGEVKVFENIDGVWVQLGLDLNEGFEYDEFGKSLCINASGTILVVGAYHNDGTDNNNGRASVYEYESGNWEQKGSYLYGSSGSQFGISVSINGIGDVIAIGAPSNEVYPPVVTIGNVKIFHFSNNEWHQFGDDLFGENQALWGWPVCLSKEGINIAIGARNHGYFSSTNDQIGIVKNYEYSFESINNLNLGNDSTICENSTIVLDAGYAENYIWNTGEITQTITVTDSGLYYVFANSLDSFNTDSILIGYYEFANVNLPSDTAINPNQDSITIEINDVFESYLWMTGGTTNSETFHYENLNDLYNTITVSVSDSNCTFIETAIIEKYICPNFRVFIDTVQLNLTDNNNLTICKDEVFYLNSDSVWFNENEIQYTQNNSQLDFFWEFGNYQDSLEGNLYSSSYSNSGVYQINVFALDTFECKSVNHILSSINVIVPFNISFQNITFLNDTVTTGDTIPLNGITSKKYYPIFSVSPMLEIPDCEELPFSSIIPVSLEGTITETSKIKSIGLNIEHSFIGDLQINLVCPNGQIIELLSYPSNCYSMNFGEPLGGYDDEITGVGYQYNFTQFANSTIPENYGLYQYEHEEIPGTSYLNYLPVGSYLPTGNFDDLLGCPINGEWELQFYDYACTDNGYLFEWSIEFDTILEEAFEPLTQSWEGENIFNNNTDTTFSIPNTQGWHEYVYSVQNDIACEYDTTFSVFVLPADTLTFLNPNPFEDPSQSITLLIENCNINFLEVDSAKIVEYSYLNDSTTEITIHIYEGSNYTELDEVIGTPLLDVYELEIIIYCSFLANSSTVIKIVDYIDTDIFTNIKNLYKSNISIYPNPALKAFTVQNDNYKGKSYTINCYSSIGVLLYSKVVDSDKTSIEISHWAEGIYIIEVDREKMKFIKK